MKKSHAENTVGPWAARKLKALEEYLRFYNTALKNQWFNRIYIDAFAGSCVSKIREPNNVYEGLALFDSDDAEAADQFVFGSPIRALNIEHGFHQHYFFDLDSRRVENLKKLKGTFSAKTITVQTGDANPLIQNLATKLHGSKNKGVAFLDPYGAHLEWATVKALADTKNFEVIINFPLAMAINRLITLSGDIPIKHRDQLNRCFGTDEWLEMAYTKEPDLFGTETAQKNSNACERLLKLYLDRLKAIFPYVAAPHLIRNTQNSPLYYLIWAGPHRLGLKGADYILNQGERAKLPQ